MTSNALCRLNRTTSWQALEVILLFPFRLSLPLLFHASSFLNSISLACLDCSPFTAMDEMEKHSPQTEMSQIEKLSTKAGEDAFVKRDFVQPTPEEEAAVIRRLDWHLLPLVFVLYSLAVLDRSNLGNARLAGTTSRHHERSVVEY